MASFGRYQSVRELHRGGFTVVYSGRTAASTAEEFAIKVIQPSALLLEREQTETKSQLFLNSARIQQKVAAGSAQHWAPIYQCGSIPDGAFYATDKYERSLQQVIEGRVKLAANDLRTIIESVVKGLIELKQVYNRPHGNLKATNVLISGSKIVLSDPLPDQYIHDQVHWDTDLRLMAEMIYQLVMHRPSPEVSAWQVPDSKEWATLGKQANDWRNLCNRLLNAHLKPGTMTIEKLIEELAQLKETKPLLSSRRLIAAGLIVLACVVTWLILSRKEVLPPEQAEWEDLCNKYIGWVDDLYNEDLNLPKGNKTADRWREDTHLKAILEKIEAASYPYDVAPETVEAIRKADKAELIDLGVERDDTLKALEAIEDVNSFFSVDDPNKTWPLLISVHDAAKGFEERRWQRSAAYLKNLVEKVKPAIGNDEIAKNVDAILDLRDILNEINSRWGNIEADKKIIESSRDPILAEFGDYIQSQLPPDEGPGTKDDLDTLHRKLEEIRTSTQKLAAYIKDDKIDHDLFRLYSDIHRSTKPISTDTLEAWMNEVKLYRVIEDPRKNVEQEWNEILKQAKTQLNQVFMDESVAEQTKAKVLKNKAKLETIESNFQKMSEILAKERIFFIERDKEAITSKLESWETQRDSVAQFALLEVSKLIRPAEWLENVLQWKVIGSQVINDYWLKKRDGILTEDVKVKLRLDEGPTLWTVRPKVEEFWTRLERLNDLGKELERNFGEKLPQPNHGISNLELQNGYYEEKEKTFRSIVTKFPEDQVPDINDPVSFKPEWQQELTAFREYSTDLAALIKVFYEVHKRFKVCYLLNDEPTAYSAGEFDELYNRLKDVDVFTDIFTEKSSINIAFQKLEGRIVGLQTIRQENERQELVKIADTSAHTEAAYAAWIRLGELPDDPPWPSKAEDWENDKKIQDRLRAEFESIQRQNKTRGDLLLKILADAGLEHEIVFRKANIERYKTTITANSSQDKILIEFEILQPAEDNLNDINDLESLARDLAVFVTDPNWPTKFRPDIFAEESPLYRKSAPTKEDFHNWLQDVEDYRKLDDDPRMNTNYTWDEKIDKIKSSINNELDREPTGEYLAKLESLVRDFNNIEPKIKDMRSLDTIKKHEEEIDKAKDYWNELLNIENRLKPRICERLELLKNGQLAFGAKFLDPNLFEPVDAVNKKPVIITGWQEIRQGISKKQKWPDFFYTIDGNDANNVGWPEYVRSTTDTSVIFSFIPGNDIRGTEPFYMAVREITNAQYRLFLQNNAKGVSAGAASFFTHRNNDSIVFIQQFDIMGDYPSSGIKWDKNEQTFVLGQWADKGKTILRDKAEPNAPVTWVTFDGAKSYATWLGVQLPTSSQHKYACKANADTAYPWGNDRYAHVRSLAWQRAADTYKLANDPVAYPPPVAKRNKQEIVSGNKELVIGHLASNEDRYKSPWPLATNTEPNTVSNNWGLYDMIGNVWELCVDEDNAQPAICGGSCLEPKEVFEEEFNYKKPFLPNQPDCDVGFRVIVPVGL